MNEKTLSNLEELSKEQENSLENNLVWVFANPRSGNTWFGTQLLTYDTLISRGPSIGLHIGAIHAGITNKVVRQFEFRSKEKDYFLSEESKKCWQYFLRKLILNRVFFQFHELNKKIVITDPEGSFGADIIADCLPNSKIIILLRDGRDVVDSGIDALRPGSWHVKNRGTSPVTPDKVLRRVKLMSKRWVRQIEILMNAYSNHSKDLRYIVRYEPLRKNTTEELKKIYDFIDVDISDEKLKELVDKYSFEKIPEDKKGPGKPRRLATPGMWKENFNEEQKVALNEIMADTLKKIDYQV